MAVVEVHPEKARTARPALRVPRRATRDDLRGGPFRDGEVVLVRALRIPLVVEVEVVREPEPRVERKGADDRGRRVAASP